MTAGPLRDLLGIEVPIVQAPMAGVSTPALAAAVCVAGGLGSLAAGLVIQQIGPRPRKDLRRAAGMRPLR